MRGSLVLLALALLPASAMANNSMAELSTGGLTYVRSDAVNMKREDLFISLDAVKVDYVFENTSDQDVESLVAFPMPPLVPSPYEGVPVPNETENFLDFRVFIEGEEVTPELSQVATAFGVDVTADIRAEGIPMMPIARSTQEALTRLAPDLLEDWRTRGIVFNDVYDDGHGMIAHPWPNWTLNEAYYWRMVFPAGKEVRVSHTYTPSVGGTAGLAFWSYDGKRSDQFGDYVEKYCIDNAFETAVKKRWPGEISGDLPLWELRISYILTTGANWFGAIGTFHLTVDKGKTTNLVSFCGTGVEKTGPTTFEMTASDFFPERNLEVLILQSSQ